MAVYNAERDLPTALGSIQEQTYAQWDLIVVNDGSTDDTGAVLDAIAAADPRVAVMHTGRNMGQAACLNLGWRNARGELIARMDADDVSRPTRFEQQVEFMHKHPTVAVLGTGAVLVDERGVHLKAALRPERHEDLARKIYKETPFFHPSVVVRRRYFEALGGYASRLRRAHDLDLWLRGYRMFRYHNLQEPLIEYRIRHSQSIRTIAEGTFVLARSAYRERLLLRRGWYAPRYFLATVLAKLGLRHLHFG